MEENNKTTEAKTPFGIVKISYDERQVVLTLAADEQTRGPVNLVVVNADTKEQVTLRWCV